MKFELKKLRSDKFLFLSIVIFSLFSLLPITRVLPTFLKAGMILASIALAFFVAIQHLRSSTGKKTYYFFAAFATAAIINLLIFIGEYQYLGEFSFASKYLMMIAFWMPFLMQILFNFTNDTKDIVKAQKILLLLLTLTAITTTIGSFIFEEASRALASNNVEANRVYQLYNIGGYGFIYAIVLSIPWVLYQIKEKKRKAYIGILVIQLLCLFRANYMTAILLTVAACVICLLFPKKEKNKILFLGIGAEIFLITMLIFQDPHFWEFMIHLVEDSDTMVFRFRNLRDLFLNRNLTGDIALRGSLYQMSWESFLDRPLLGNIGAKVPNELGYHSELIDYLGGTGILGILVFALFLFSFFSTQNKKLPYEKSMRRYAVVSWLMFLILASINTVIGSIEISTVMGILYFPEIIKETNVENETRESSKKVLVIQHTDLIGGSLNGALQLVETLKHSGKYKDVDVYINNTSGKAPGIAKEHDLNLVATGLHSPTFDYFNGCNGFGRVLLKYALSSRHSDEWQSFFNKNKYEAVVLNTSVLWPLREAIQASGAKCFCYVRETVKGKPSSFINKQIRKELSKCDKVFFLTEFDKNEWNVSVNEQYVIPETVDLDELLPIPKETAREKLGLDQDVFYVLYMGGMQKLKGCEQILQAFHCLSEREDLKNKKIKLLFLGDPGTAKYNFVRALKYFSKFIYQKRMVSFIEKHQLDHCIDRVGVQKDIAEWISAADILVFPTTVVHQARPIYEAGCIRKTIIVPDYENYKNNLIDGYNGITYAKENYQDLAEKIIYAYENRDKLKELGEHNFEMTCETHIQAKVKVLLEQALLN